MSEYQTGAPRLHQHLIEQILYTLFRIMGEGVYADKAIEQAFKQHPKWGSRDRRLFAESTYDMVRWWRMLWHLAALPDKSHLDPQALTETALWRVWGVYWLSRGHTLPDWPECRGVRMAKGEPENAAIAAAIPDWMYERAERELGKKAWQPLLEALNQPTDVFLRVNTLKYNVRDLQIKLGAEKCKTQTVVDVPDAIRLVERRNVFLSPLFKAGYFEVQDAASQIIAPFVQPEPGMRVIDSCAGAGGKTLHLATLMKNKGRIIALDVHDWKLKELRRRATRNGIDNIEERVIDGNTIKRLAGSADRVLLDVPCSGLGVLRRNPDAKWKLSNEEIDRLIALQAEILRSHSRMVKPGGKLVYATCSILPSENENQINAFLAEHGNEWKLDNQIHLRPDKQGFDGFYAARLTRIDLKA